MGIFKIVIFSDYNKIIFISVVTNISIRCIPFLQYLVNVNGIIFKNLDNPTDK